MSQQSMRRAFGIATSWRYERREERAREREGWDGLESMSVALLRSKPCFARAELRRVAP